MPILMRPAVCSATLVAVLVAAPAPAQLKFDRGQNVQPVFEGWERNADGTFDMVFGYLNRNYAEIPEVPVGASNFFEPGPADRGQPARFYPRRQQFVFRVPVPADWGDRDLVWTVTSHGRTDQAFGSLWPSWEIDDGVIKANRGSGANGAPADNQRPTISIREGTALSVTRPAALTLTAVVGDDGIPGARPERPPPSDPRLAEFRRRMFSQPSPNNQAIVSARTAHTTGLGVTFIHYRGPGTVTFDPMAAPIDGGRGGDASTTVTFTEPGTHLIRAYADDSINTTPVDITVTVN